MLSLDSPQWGVLRHAYGTASDIPELLRRLYDVSACDPGEDEPWATLWSSLAHQGDVYSATFAAVPHVVAALADDPIRAGSEYFQFPAWVECCRLRKNVSIPDDRVLAYKRALSRLPQLVADASKRPWNDGFMQCALAAIAAAKGEVAIAEAVLELDSDVAEQFLEWFHDR